MSEPGVPFLLAIFAFPAFGLLVGVGAVIAERLRSRNNAKDIAEGDRARRCTIHLPDAMARTVNAKVASGQYGSADQVILEGLRALMDNDPRLRGRSRCARPTHSSVSRPDFRHGSRVGPSVEDGIMNSLPQVGTLPAACCRLMITNSAGLSGANPIWMLTTPRSTSALVVVSLPQFTK